KVSHQAASAVRRAHPPAAAERACRLPPLPPEYTMEVRPMVALRAALVGGIAAFAKIGGAMKAAGGVKLGAAAAAVTAAASAAVSGKDTSKDASKAETK
ncbi:unnamed protein product, partial [Urochloa humidicola]